MPSNEARLSVQEELTSLILSRVTQVSMDIQASFKANASYQIEQERKIEALFDTVDRRFDAMDKRFDTVDMRMSRMETMLAGILERLQ